MENETNFFQEEQQEQDATMSTGNWVLTLFLTAIPLVGIVLLFVWAFGGNSRYKERVNYAKAVLIWMAIGFLLTALFWGSIDEALMGVF
ncbi:MAG: hypothetical protein RRX93_02560 [Bacteroidales bacterium]